MKTIKTSLALVFLFFTAVGCSDSVVDANLSADGASKAGRPNADFPNIVDVASANPDFTVLVQAVVFADLAEALSGKGQFTVFAPTNAAFGNLLQTLGLTAGELLSESNRELVTKILLYHVAPGRRYADQVIASDRINTLAKEFATIRTEDTAEGENGKVFIDSAEIIAPNVDSFDGEMISNGVIHVIDAVILPPSVEAALGISQ